MALFEPAPPRAVFDPTRDPDAEGPPSARRRYWSAAVVGVLLLALAIAALVWAL